MRGDNMIFFKKKTKYLTITSGDETCATVNLNEIVVFKKYNFDNNIFGIEIVFKNGNLFRFQQKNLGERNQEYERIKNYLFKNL